MSKPTFLLEFDRKAVKRVSQQRNRDGKIVAAVVLRNQKPRTMREIASAFQAAANELYDAADSVER